MNTTSSSRLHIVRFFRGISEPEYSVVVFSVAALNAGVGKLDEQCFGQTRCLLRASQGLEPVVVLSSQACQS